MHTRTAYPSVRKKYSEYSAANGSRSAIRIVTARIRPGEVQSVPPPLLEQPMSIRRLHAAIEFFEDESEWSTCSRVYRR